MTNLDSAKTHPAAPSLDDESNWYRRRFKTVRKGMKGLRDDMEPGDESDIARKKKRFLIIAVFGIIMTLIAFSFQSLLLPGRRHSHQ